MSESSAATTTLSTSRGPLALYLCSSRVENRAVTGSVNLLPRISGPKKAAGLSLGLNNPRMAETLRMHTHVTDLLSYPAALADSGGNRPFVREPH